MNEWKCCFFFPAPKKKKNSSEIEWMNGQRTFPRAKKNNFPGIFWKRQKINMFFFFPRFGKKKIRYLWITWCFCSWIFDVTGDAHLRRPLGDELSLNAKVKVKVVEYVRGHSCSQPSYFSCLFFYHFSSCVANHKIC